MEYKKSFKFNQDQMDALHGAVRDRIATLVTFADMHREKMEGKQGEEYYTHKNLAEYWEEQIKILHNILKRLD